MPIKAAPPLAFTGVTIVDVRDGQHLPDQTVVITGSRIQAVGKTGEVRPPQEAQVIDSRGKYLIPGLWDMHIHVFGHSEMYPLFLANGVTGVREMSQIQPYGLDSMLQWRHEIAAGMRVGPRIIGTGASLYGSGEGGPFGDAETQEIVTATPEEGRHAVDSLKAAGADFIKIHSVTDRAVYFATAAEARRVGIPLVGHIGHLGIVDGEPIETDITEIEASDSGQKSVEHAESFPCALSGEPNAAEKRCSEVAKRFIHNGTWMTPTLMFYYTLNDDAIDLTSFQRYQQAVQVMHRFGTPMLAGTDATPGTRRHPGSLHDELRLLVDAGLTPLEALQAATLNPAQFFGATDSLGTIMPGKLADLVLLDADPLADVRNTAKIQAVVANGRYFNRAALDALLAGGR